MTAENNHITIYATTWCPYCTNLIKRLDRTETPYAVVDVEEDAEAASWVESVNDGNRVVPTVQYSDGTHATNPEASAVRRKLEELIASAGD
ncbi:mycoredoxin [Corynebacterium sp. YIM 101645]|uniref:Mycoredoxin n=1 Tax=Corynebacterium lemuris TaxID=1859292 RepID=A0ABT2FZL5_9CORY|nr:mycoredoxin [Corynebacterium lemuris]MCS5480459.1 mycoredoxin [Corynebacterium lemuris]